MKKKLRVVISVVTVLVSIIFISPVLSIEEDNNNKKSFVLCNCPFDCLTPVGIEHHNIKLTESDLERLPAASRDLQRFLQHKCYSKLTGEDRELFPDLKLIDNGDDVDDHDEAEEKQTFSVDVADTQAASPPSTSSTRSTHIVFDSLLIPCITFVSFITLALIVLWQRQCEVPSSSTGTETVRSIPAVDAALTLPAAGGGYYFNTPHRTPDMCDHQRATLNFPADLETTPKGQHQHLVIRFPPDESCLKSDGGEKEETWSLLKLPINNDKPVDESYCFKSESTLLTTTSELTLTNNDARNHFYLKECPLK